MNSFLTALNAVMPMFLYMSFGYIIKSVNIADEEFLRRLNVVIFKAFFPILMFNNIYQTNIGKSINVKLFIFSLLVLIFLSIVSMLIVPKFIKENPVRGVFIQSIFRSNFVLFGTALASSVYGSENLGVVSVVTAVVAPTLNILAVIVLETFRGGEVKIKNIITAICKNPLIIGVVAGIVYNVLPITTPDFLQKSIKDLASITTPLALLVLGGTLKFSSISKNVKFIVPSVFLKLIAVPTATVVLGILLGFTGIELFTILVLFGSPCAAASYAMAQSMGGDFELAGQLVAITTVISIFTMFIFIFVLNSMSFI
ncbi:MAG: AEC family transporter [Lachnospiraceae bacterium]|nr:AEC family transporter [Lachnospiraceae bacterium]